MTEAGEIYTLDRKPYILLYSVQFSNFLIFILYFAITYALKAVYVIATAEENF